MQNYKQKEYVRIIGNTITPSIKEMNEMIGKVYEVMDRSYSDDTVLVCTQDKSDDFWFDTSDTQKVFINDIKDGVMEGCVKDGYAIGKDDLIKWGSSKFIAYDFCLEDGKIWTVKAHRENDEDCTLSFEMSEDFKVTPKYPTEKSLSGKEVTVTLDGKTYKAIIQ